MDMLTFSKEREPDFAAGRSECGRRRRRRADASAGPSELKVELRWRARRDDPHAHVRSEGIHRAVLNVATNAIDACDERDERRR